MQTIESIDLSILPPQARLELYDVYLFLQQRYANNPVQITQTNKKETALKNFLENNKNAT